MPVFDFQIMIKSKVLIPAGLFYPSLLGGPANTYYWLAKALVKNNVDVTVVASNSFIRDKSIVFDKWMNLDGIRVRYCSTKSKLSIKIIWHTIKSLRSTDVLLLGSIAYLSNFFIVIPAILLNKKIIWSIRGELFEDALGKNRKNKIIYFKLLKLFFSKSVVFHATSTDEQNLIFKYFGSKVKAVVIPNYMELPQQMEKSGNNHFFLYAGRLNSIKALDNIILALLKSELFLSSDFKFVLAGMNQDDYQKELELIIDRDERLRKRVIFTGNLERNELNKLYANAHFLLLLSHSENFGNVVIESLSQGTPVVTSHGTPWAVLEEFGAGYWIDNNVENISNYIEKIMNLSEADYYKLRENAKKLSKTFDVYSNIDKWLRIL